jgi:hypothetical protein
MATKFTSALTETVEFSIEYALLEIGKMVTADIRRRLMRPGTGRIYASKRGRSAVVYGASTLKSGGRNSYKYKSEYLATKKDKKFGYQIRGLKHRASVPWASPAPDTEALRNSIDFEVSKRGGGYKTLWITSNSPYAKYMELGTHKVAPRPFIRPSVYLHINKLGPAVAKAFRFRFAASMSGNAILSGFKFK